MLTLQLTDGLYSPHVEAEQFEAIQGEVKSVLDSFMEKLFKEHVQVCAWRGRVVPCCQAHVYSVIPAGKL